MNRRDWMKVWAAAPLASAMVKGASRNEIVIEPYRLQLRHTWTTTMSSSTFRDEVQLRWTADGITAHGEAAPIVRYKENADGVQAALREILPQLIKSDPSQFRRVLDAAAPKLVGQNAAKAAIDIALMDWTTQKLGVPLYRYLGLDPQAAPITTYSIGIDTPEMTQIKVGEAEDFPVLKVKVGLDKDEASIEALRSATQKPIRPDANEGFKTKEEAVRKINWLESQGAEFIEQPMRADLIEEARWIRSRVHIPVFADEAAVHPSDIPKLADAFDGVVVKLQKCGGIQEVLKMIDTARAFKMKVMIGCMIESSVGITAAAHLAPLCDYADLDGNLLIGNDPFHGVTVRKGHLILPDGPGLGLTKA